MGSTKKRKPTTDARKEGEDEIIVVDSKQEQEEEAVPLDNDTIFRIVNEIQAARISETQRKTHFQDKYPEFVDMYPSLFEMACKVDFEKDKFEYMMRLRSQIQANKRSVDDTSREVGQKFYDMYMNKKDVKL